MSEILFAEGFDCGRISRPDIDVYNKGSSAYASAGQKKTGGYSLFISNQWIRWPISGTPNDPSVSLWVYPGGAWDGDTGFKIQFLLTSGQYVSLYWRSATKTFDAYVNGVNVASGTVAFPNNTWHHVQFALKVDDAPNGTIDVKIDGVSSIAYTGDTKPGATDTVEYLYLNYSVPVDNTWVDDLVIGRGGFLGDLRCVDIRPNADTAQDDWTPSAGDNYSTIDEINANLATIDSDYNETNTDAQADELALTDFDGATYVPVAVYAWVRAWELAANGDAIKVGIDSNGVDEVTQHTLATSGVYYGHIATENPDGPAAWDDAAIDALLLRYESVIS
jgi:hypothetical protein